MQQSYMFISTGLKTNMMSIDDERNDVADDDT